MNRTPTILSGIALLGVIILFILHFSSAKKVGTITTTSGAVPAGVTRVAYIDIDTFEARYIAVKSKKDEFAARQNAMEAELQQSQEQMQRDYNSLQQRAQEGKISQSEGEAAARRIKQMDQTLQARSQSLNIQLKKDLDAFNNDLHKRMDDFLESYNKEHHYDYVLTYSRSNPLILYGNKSLDITEDVVKGMNERTEKNGSNDTAKGK